MIIPAGLDLVPPQQQVSVVFGTNFYVILSPTIHLNTFYYNERRIH